MKTRLTSSFQEVFDLAVETREMSESELKRRFPDSAKQDALTASIEFPTQADRVVEDIAQAGQSWLGQMTEIYQGFRSDLAEMGLKTERQALDGWAAFGESVRRSFSEAVEATKRYYQELIEKIRFDMSRPDQAFDRKDLTRPRGLMLAGQDFERAASSLGLETQFMSMSGMLLALNAAGDQVLKDRRAAYKSMASGMGFPVQGMESERPDYDARGQINAYLDEVRLLRVKYPSMAEEFGGAMMTLRQNLPISEQDQQDLGRDLADTRRAAIFLGKSLSDSTNLISQSSRLFDQTTEQTVASLRMFTDIGLFYSRISGVQIDIEEFRQRILKLQEIGLYFHLTQGESAQTVLNFAKYLDRAVMNLQDLEMMLAGMGKGDLGASAGLAELMIRNLEGTGEYQEILRLLKTGKSPTERGRLLQSIVQRWTGGYEELGIKIDQAQADQIGQLFHDAFRFVMRQESARMGGDIHTQRMWEEQLWALAGALNIQRQIYVRRAIIEGREPDIPPELQNLDMAEWMRQYMETLPAWRTRTDKIQSLMEDVAGKINQATKAIFQEEVDWRRGISPTEIVNLIKKEGLTWQTIEKMNRARPAASAQYLSSPNIFPGLANEPASSAHEESGWLPANAPIIQIWKLIIRKGNPPLPINDTSGITGTQ